jgi:hypothetical protein
MVPIFMVPITKSGFTDWKQSARSLSSFMLTQMVWIDSRSGATVTIHTISLPTSGWRRVESDPTGDRCIPVHPAILSPNRTKICERRWLLLYTYRTKHPDFNDSGTSMLGCSIV